jgi:hypothetical protein
MQYVHIRSLEKYHPKYKDRTLQWAKIYFQMAQGDPDCDLIDNEIDWGRLIKLILLELQAKTPLPNVDSYWLKKGFDIKKRPMSLTLQMLHNFIEPVRNDYIDKDKDKEDKDKEDKDIRKKMPKAHLSDIDFITSLKTNTSYKHINIDIELGKMDAWISARPGRQKTRRFIVNWLNKIDKPIVIEKPKPKEEPKPESGLRYDPRVSKLIHEMKEKMK